MKAFSLLARASLIALLPLSAPLAAEETPPDPAAINAAINAPLPADQAAIKAHVLFLASDAISPRNMSRRVSMPPGCGRAAMPAPICRRCRWCVTAAPAKAARR